MGQSSFRRNGFKSVGKQLVRDVKFVSPSSMKLMVVGCVGIQVIQKLARSRTGAAFAVPVTDDIAPNYSTEIKRPMDLGTLADRLQNGKYRSVGECAGHETAIPSCSLH
jgi:hypothetical protein